MFFWFIILFFFLMIRRPPCSPLFPYTTLFRSRLRATSLHQAPTSLHQAPRSMSCSWSRPRSLTTFQRPTAAARTPARTLVSRSSRSMVIGSPSDGLVAQVDGAAGLQLEAGQLAGGGPLHLEAQALVGGGEVLGERLGQLGPGGVAGVRRQLDPQGDAVEQVVAAGQPELELLDHWVLPHDRLDRPRVDVGAADELHVVHPRAVEAIVAEYPVVEEFQLRLPRGDDLLDRITLRIELPGSTTSSM